ncbi:hypothetical protein KKD91_03510 [Patescibacteria group bacterium]|nr:hypothetical protein [Patescibacteria group bacterium]MCG2700422.1 hypothetical protein [Candidatus Parcubacteria bacterium]
MDSKEKWTAEISRSAQSVRDSQFVTEKGLITEKALEIFHIPRSVQDIDVITLADEYNCALEAAIVLFLMASRDGEPRTGANLYSPGIGLLFWDINWTASTKLKIWRLHQALKVGCKDDLDFVIKLAYCFLRAEKNNIAELWTKYFQVNYQVMQEALNDARDIFASHYRMNALEEERAIDINIVGRIRQVFVSTWQNRVAKITGDKPVPCLKVEKERIAAISQHCIYSQTKGEEVIMAAATDGMAIVGGYPRQMPVASFIVCLEEESQEEKSNFFADQFLPIGSLVNVTKKGKKILVGGAVEFPSAVKFYYKRTLNGDGSPKKEMLSVSEFVEEFVCSEFKEEGFEATGEWIGEDESDRAIVINWTEESGCLVAILAPIKATESKSILKVGDTLKATIQKVVRDPNGKGGFVLTSLAHNPCVPIEINAISLSPAGYGSEKIEGQTLNLSVEGFDEEGNPLLSNIDSLKEDLGALREEISESEKATKTSEKSYIELSAVAVKIDEDEEEAVVVIERGKGIVHPIKVSQTYVPGGDLKNLRIDEKIIVRLFNRTDDEISVEYFTEEEMKSMPRSWRLNETKDKVVLPLCLEDKDLERWNVRSELVDFVKRHSWQYCIGARINSLKERISKLKEGNSVNATVRKIDYNEAGEIDKVYVIFGDSVPASILGRSLSSTEISEGDEISLCIRSVDPQTGRIFLVDKEKELELITTDIQQKKETITRWQGNIENSEGYIVSLIEQVEKLQYGIANARTVEYAAERIVWLSQKRSKIEQVENQIQEWREKISSVQKELRELRQKLKELQQKE